MTGCFSVMLHGHVSIPTSVLQLHVWPQLPAVLSVHQRFIVELSCVPSRRALIPWGAWKERECGGDVCCRAIS